MTKFSLTSPWLEQLPHRRVSQPLHHDHYTDVAVVGAGIAGVTTAYFLLKTTWKRVALIESDRVAHGATGHNAGQLVSYFERSFTDMTNEFGVALTADGHRAVESSWDLLEDMRRDLQLETPCLTFTGYAGCSDAQEVLSRLQDNLLRVQGGLAPEMMYVADTFARHTRIPKKYRGLYEVIPHQDLLELLQTKDRHYVATLTKKKGCMNSALFCEEAIGKLIARHPHRLLVAEQTPVSVVRLYRRHAELVSGKHTVHAKRVVLCTNGFERLHIENKAGANIDVKFHHLVRGSVGYMAAFTEEPPAAPTAISYLPKHAEGAGAYNSEPYFYLTRRPYKPATDLVCVGGPEALMDDTNNYSQEHPYPAEAKKMIDAFVRKTYRHTGRRLHYSHLWHGLMGYTPNGIRCVGAEPCNPVLMYNLGCNGVGILPSVYGSSRIAQLIKGKKLAPSIFDPADQRCLMPEPRRAEDRVGTYQWFARHTVWGFVTMWAIATACIVASYWLKAARLGEVAVESGL